MTDASEQNNTGPLGGPVIMVQVFAWNRWRSPRCEKWLQQYVSFSMEISAVAKRAVRHPRGMSRLTEQLEAWLNQHVVIYTVFQKNVMPK